jgi:hypothetical protein
MIRPNPGEPQQLEKEWFERVPWTTIIIILILFLKDKDFLIYSVGNSLYSVGIDVDFSLLSSSKWIWELLESAHFHNYTLETKHIHTAILGYSLWLFFFMFMIQIVLGEIKARNAYSKDDVQDELIRSKVRLRLARAPAMLNYCMLAAVVPLYLIEHMHTWEDFDSCLRWFVSPWTNVGMLVAIWLCIFFLAETVFCYRYAREHHWAARFIPKRSRPAVQVKAD